MKLSGRTVNPGVAEGEAIVTGTPFSFLGELDPTTGKVPSPSHELFGQSVKDKVLVCPTGKGSTVGPIIAWYSMKAANNPKAMVCIEAEPIIASVAIMADIPMVHRLDKNPLDAIKSGDHVKVDATAGIVEIFSK
jgi:predicted aconitase with swiveling domain